MLSQDFIEKNRLELIRTVSVCMSLFTLLIGFNIGSNSTYQEIAALKARIQELDDFIKIDQKQQQEELLLQQKACEEKIAILQNVTQEKEKALEAIDQSIVIQKQMKCQGK
jgi:hypothetical protein